VLGSLLVLGSGASRPGALLDSVPLADLLEILVDGRQVLAIDAETGGQLTKTLDLDETVVWSGSRGAVGLVLTDQRLLAAAVASGTWQEARYRRGEAPTGDPVLGDRVALVVTNRRVLGFDGGSRNLVESGLGLREKLIAIRAGENVGVVVTDRRALGLSPAVGGFFEVGIYAQERIGDVSARANLVTITTNRRILIFRTGTGTWEERLRGPR